MKKSPTIKQQRAREENWTIHQMEMIKSIVKDPAICRNTSAYMLEHFTSGAQFVINHIRRSQLSRK